MLCVGWLATPPKHSLTSKRGVGGGLKDQDVSGPGRDSGRPKAAAGMDARRQKDRGGHGCPEGERR